MTKKETMIKAFNSSSRLDKSRIGIILFLQGALGERELVANPEGQDKINYIIDKYNDDLELVENTKIKIVNYQFFDNNNPVSIEISLGRKLTNEYEK